MTFGKKPVNPRTRLVGMAALAASVAVIVLTGSPSLEQQDVEGALKDFSDFVSADTAKSGKEGRFTYGAIEMKGWLNHFAMVKDVSLEIKKQSLLDSVTWALKTPAMAVTYDQQFARRMYFIFGQPISITKNGQLAATISFKGSLKYGQMLTNHDSNTTLAQNIRMPASIVITPAQSSQGGDVQITYDPNPTLQVFSSTKTADRHARYEINNIKVTSGTAQPLSILGLKSTRDERTVAEGEIDGHYTLNLTQVKPEGLATACNITADINYTGDQPFMKLAGMVASTPQTALKVNSLALDCGEFSISAGGNVARSPEDPLPNGQLSVKITEVNKLLASGLLADQAKAVLSQVLEKVSGQPVASLTTVELPLKREKGGTFYIGDQTFEQIATSMLTNMIAPPQPSAPVELQAPSAGAPVPLQEPQKNEVIDQSAAQESSSAEPKGAPAE